MPYLYCGGAGCASLQHASVPDLQHVGVDHADGDQVGHVHLRSQKQQVGASEPGGAAEGGSSQSPASQDPGSRWGARLPSGR